MRENSPRIKLPTTMSNPPDLEELEDHGPFVRPTAPARPSPVILSNPPPLVTTEETLPSVGHKEIERKFLLKDGVVFSDRVERSQKIIQGYLSMGPIVRVRIQDGYGYLTIKSEGLLTRSEYEYLIPLRDAEDLLKMCVGSVITKTRHIVIAREGDLTTRWEVDEFHSPVKRWMAEVELRSEDAPFVKPSWVGEEVTHDPRYTNAAISTVPTR